MRSWSVSTGGGAEGWGGGEEGRPCVVSLHHIISLNRFPLLPPATRLLSIIHQREKPECKKKKKGQRVRHRRGVQGQQTLPSLPTRGIDEAPPPQILLAHFTFFYLRWSKAWNRSVTCSTLKLEPEPECPQATRRCTHQTSLPSHVTQQVANSVSVDLQGHISQTITIVSVFFFLMCAGYLFLYSSRKNKKPKVK